MTLIICHAYSKVFLVLLFFAADVNSLLCYNGTFTSLEFADDPLAPRGLFSPQERAVERLRCAVTVPCGENAMCFVRSWSARAKHAWLVQRGCYRASREDPLPRGLLTPTRAMACKRERLREAEYKVCLCQADWCNLAKSHYPHRTPQFMQNLISITVSIFTPYLYVLYH